MNRSDIVSALSAFALLLGISGYPVVAFHAAGGAEEDVKPGQIDYPLRNEHPVRVLTLTGTLPATLRIRFLVNYTAIVPPTSVPPEAINHCAFRDVANILRPFDITEPLHITRDGAHFRATVVADKYLPGPCQWHFNLVGFTVPNGVGPLAEGWFARAYEARRDVQYLGDLYEGPIDEWCKKNPYPPDARRPEQCGNLSTIQVVAPIRSELLERIAVDERRDQVSVWVFPDTRSIEVDFHDLDALNASGGGSRNHR